MKSDWSFVVLVLLIAWIISDQLPQWYISGGQLISVHSLFVGIFLLVLCYLVLWKLPRWYVVAVPYEKDRLDVE